MFKGIIKSIGQIFDVTRSDGGFIICIKSNLVSSKLLVGDSVACNGVCLTVEKFDSDLMWFYASLETLSLTNLTFLKKDDFVNLESSLKVGETLDGHFVQGHVDCKVAIKSIKQQGDSWVFCFDLPDSVTIYVVKKCSLAVDGVSLTVNEVDKDYFEVNIIPHTFSHTIFQYKKVGDFVNLEVDMLARHLEKLLQKS